MKLEEDGRFRLALEATPTGMVMVDHEGRIVLVNAQVQEVFGYAAEELVGKPIEVLLPGRFRTDHPHLRAAFAREPRVRPMGEGRDLYGLRRDGSEVPVEVGLNPLQTEEGNFVLCSIVDITERKRAFEQFRLAIEASPTGMLAIDEEGRIVLVNEQIETMFGYERSELLGHAVEKLVPVRFRSAHPHLRSGFFETPKARPMGAGRDLYGLRKDGTEVPIEIGLNPIQTSSGRFVLSSVVDITERKRTESMLREQGVKLERRSAEREVLLKEVYHRVKNNLQVISSLLGMQSEAIEDAGLRALFLESQSRVLSIALVHEQLYQSPDLTCVDLGAYCSELVQHLEGTLSNGDQVRIEVVAESAEVPVDVAIPCGLIITELVTNALKHAFPPGRRGRVRVVLRVTDTAQLILSVSDNGQGLPELVVLGKTKTLGMDLVDKLVKQLRGSMDVERAQGTTFELTLRLPQGTAPSPSTLWENEEHS